MSDREPVDNQGHEGLEKVEKPIMSSKREGAATSDEVSQAVKVHETHIAGTRDPRTSNIDPDTTASIEPESQSENRFGPLSARFAPWELHPALTHFPIAFLLGGVILDCVAWWRRRLGLAQVATGLIIAGLVLGLLTALAGVLAFFTVPAHTPEAHALMYWHLVLQSSSLILFTVAALPRYRGWAFLPTAGSRLIGFVGALFLVVGSALGGYIVYHGGAGVEPKLLALNLRQGHSHGTDRLSVDQSDLMKKPTSHEINVEHAIVETATSDTTASQSQEQHAREDMKKLTEEQQLEGRRTDSGLQSRSPNAQGKSQEEFNATIGSDDREDQKQPQMVNSFAFQPFATTPPDDGIVRGTTKANGAILRMNPDGSDLEVFAWGLRNPFGLIWSVDGQLYASDNGYDERGSRPIAHAPDCFWLIKQDAWYGFPDYAGGIPVTDSQFVPEEGPAPRFLMRDHPNIEKPLATLAHHVGAAKMDVSPNQSFGEGQIYLALSGDMNPITGKHRERSGFEVVRIDPKNFTVTTFLKANPESLGPQGWEYVTTAGPRRPVDVRFSPDGNAMYVVDVGAMGIESTATGPSPLPFPSTGVVWRIVPTRGNESAEATNSTHQHIK